jgi:hypothetical protein
VVAVAQWLRRQVVALKIEGSIPSSHPKSAKVICYAQRPYDHSPMLPGMPDSIRVVNGITLNKPF